MIRGIAHKVLVRYLSDYIKNFNSSIELFSGKISLDNVMIREQVAENIFDLNNYAVVSVSENANASVLRQC